MFEPQHRGVATRPFDRVQEQHVVVLRKYPRCVGEHCQQIGRIVSRRGQCRAVDALRRRGSDRAVIERRRIVQRCRGYLGQNRPIEPVANAQRATVGDPTDDRRAYVPAITDLEHTREVGGFDDGEHAFLRLARHDLERLHRGLAHRDRIHVDVHADATA